MVDADPTVGSARSRVDGPVLPDYGGACIASVTPTLRAIVSGRSGGSPLPGWVPDVVRRSRQVVLLVLDGLGWEKLTSATDLAPNLLRAEGGPITSVVPTTTATALTSISTGTSPAEHGIVGYRLLVGTGGDDGVTRDGRGAGGSILNVLKWRVDGSDARQTIPPRTFQPLPAFGGDPVPAVTRGFFVATGFSAAHLDGARMTGWQMPSTLVVEIGRLLAAGEPFVHAYYDGLDNVAHEHGLGLHYAAELRSVDRIVGDLVEVLPLGACLVVTSDHGQVEVGRSAVMPDNELLEASSLLSGEGRFRWFHARPGAAADLEAAASELHGDTAWVRTIEQMQDESWFGGRLPKHVASRLGDVALVAREPVAFLDPADTGESRLAARHGSLTPAEMFVPLVALGASD
jgi:hypothetical protein